jgi:peptidoglycan/LPS O-acetylase OafA/YrhL
MSSTSLQFSEPSAVSPQATGHRWYAALDGYRGLAVIAVVLFHAGIIEGGWLGVDLFFVLSGFLITRLIRVEHDRNSSISLVGFWRRRARRLLPALVIFFPIVALLVWWAPERRLVPANVGAEMIASIAYVANWFTLFATGGYWDQFSADSPLRHMWSLAIEEQFYVLFPLVAVVAFAARRRHTMLWVLGALTIASWTWAMVLLGTGASFERVYLGTDTRLAALTLGGVAGYLSVSDSFMGRATPVVRRLAWPALVLVIAAMVVVTGDADWTPQRWLVMVVFELAVVVILLGGLNADGVSTNRFAATRVLVWFGAISYGLYLWHIPVQFVLAQQWPGLNRWVVAAVMLGAGSAIAWVSYRLVEQPIRHRGLVGVFGAPARQIGAVALSVVVLIAGVTITYRSTDELRDEQLVVDLLPAPPPAAQVPVDSVPPTTIDVEAGAAVNGNSEAEASQVVEPAVLLPIARPVDRLPSVLFFGDSMVAAIRDGLEETGEELEVAFAASSHIGCSVGGREFRPDSVLDTEPRVASCAEWLASLPSIAQYVQPDVIVILRNGVRPPSETTGLEVCGEQYRQWFYDEAVAEIEAIAAVSAAQIVITTYSYPRYLGDIKPDEDREFDCINEVLRDVVAETGVALVDIAGWVCPTVDTCKSRVDGVSLRPDGYHFEGDGAAVMLAWLTEQLFVA